MSRCLITPAQIAEVKNYFADHKKQYEDQLRRLKESQPADSSPGTAWLFGLTKRIDHEDILAAFPPRQTADLLITRYFNTYDPILRKQGHPGEGSDEAFALTRTRHYPRSDVSETGECAAI